jgi:hypothetical protein
MTFDLRINQFQLDTLTENSNWRSRGRIWFAKTQTYAQNKQEIAFNCDVESHNYYCIYTVS